MDAAEATWEPLDDFRSAHPSFQLEDELFVEGGGGRCYGSQGLHQAQETSRLSPGRASRRQLRMSAR
jgi:hypothetical protein